MRLLRVIHSMNPAHGGPCQGIRNIVPSLEKLGVQNEVVSLDAPDAPFLGKDSFKVHALGPAKGPWRYAENLTPWLIENLHRYDIVIIHGLWLFYGHATRKAIEKFRGSSSGNGYPKLLVMPHGMLDPYFQRAPDRKLKAIRNWVYWKFIENKVINDADGILFTCEAELLLAREPFIPYHPKRELNVGYGIEPPPAYAPFMKEAFKKACPELRDEPYVLFLSRIQEKKGVDLLIKAYKKSFRPGWPKLVIAGPGMESVYGQRLRRLVSDDPKIKDSIFFPGMLSGDKKWGAFYGCEAFVLPSHQENFGIAVVEALACSKPVLISNQVNIWKEIESEGAGLIADNTEKGTEKLLEDWHEMSAGDKMIMGTMARRCFEKYYSNGPAAVRLKQTLEKLLS